MSNPFKSPDEWLKQAVYDLETAEAMFATKRYIYSVFMCHLSVEKLLKAIYAKELKEDPPKIHDLIYLVKKVQLELPHKHQECIKNLNELSVPTRYPEELEKLLEQYTKERTENLLNQTKELFQWLKERL